MPEDLSDLQRQKLALVKASIVYCVAIAVVKITGATLTASVGFFSEALDAVIDVGGAIVSYFGMKQSIRPADEEHHFGHEKIESLLGFFQVLVVIGLYGYVVFISLRDIVQGARGVQNSRVGIIMLLVTVSVAVIYSRYLIVFGRKHQSLILESQGLNFFGDNLKSVLVVFGLYLSSLGLAVADPIVALLVSLYIIRQAILLGREGLKDILDESPLSRDQMATLKNLLKEHMRTAWIENLRVRASSATLFVDVELHYTAPAILPDYPRLAKDAQAKLAEAFPKFHVDFSPHFHPHFATTEVAEVGDILDHLSADFAGIPTADLTKDVYKDRYKTLKTFEKKAKKAKKKLKKKWKKRKKQLEKAKKDK